MLGLLVALAVLWAVAVLAGDGGPVDVPQSVATAGR